MCRQKKGTPRISIETIETIETPGETTGETTGHSHGNIKIKHDTA